MRPALLLIPILASACGGEPGIDDGPIRLRGRCEAGERLGGFQVIAGEVRSFAAGAIADRVNPIAVRAEIAAAGGCRLLRREVSFCDPACGAGEICGADGACQPLPTKLDVGEVRIAGTEPELTLAPRPPGNDYFETDLPTPPFADGAEIRVRGDGVSLDGLGSAPLSGVAGPWQVNAGEPVALLWDPPPDSQPGDAATRITAQLVIDQHGNTPAALVCELPDTGAGEIPAALVDALLDSGVSGFPDATIGRATFDREPRDGAGEPGCVDLEVGHALGVGVSVDGHTPCDAPGQCPDGQTCDLELQTCVAG